MLPKQHRLPLRTEFRRIKKQGKFIQGSFFSLIICSRLSVAGCQSASRFAFIVSKKINPLATRRNRIRRLLSEAIYSGIAEIKPGFDFVFLVKKSILGKNLTEIKKEISQFLTNEKIYPRSD